MRYLPAILLMLGLTLGLLAWGVWFVSGAHGHGLASPDRAAILVLATAAAVALICALAVFVRRARRGSRVSDR